MNNDNMPRLRIKDPIKWATRELRRIGCRRKSETRSDVFFELPDGRVERVNRWIHAGTAVVIVSRIRRELGIAAPIGGDAAPQIVKGKVQMTAHSLERLVLMSKQAAIGVPEVEAALYFPELVVADERQPGAWQLTRGRLKAVVLFDDTGVAHVKTVLWAHEELWELHPRPAAVAS